MKKAILGLVILLAGMNAQAAIFMAPTVFDGSNLSCMVPGPAYGMARVAAIQFNYSCMDNYGAVWNYNPIVGYNNITSDVYAGTVKPFFGPNMFNCRLVASSCTVRTLN